MRWVRREEDRWGEWRENHREGKTHRDIPPHHHQETSTRCPKKAKANKKSPNEAGKVEEAQSQILGRPRRAPGALKLISNVEKLERALVEEWNGSSSLIAASILYPR